jgi:hypothetical protein
MADHLYESYRDHASTLRTWLVAYGIGAPAVILSNEALWKRVEDAGIAKCVGLLFLLGVAIQVVLAAVNKAVMWIVYFGDDNDAYKATKTYKVACAIAKAFWFDLLCDLAAMVLFTYATYTLFAVVA